MIGRCQAHSNDEATNGPRGLGGLRDRNWPDRGRIRSLSEPDFGNSGWVGALGL